MPVNGSELDRVDRLRVGTPAAVSAGQLSVSGNFDVAGTVTLSGNQTVSGNLAVTGTLGVTGATTLGVLGATGAVTLTSGVNLAGAPTPVAGQVAFGNEVDARANATGRGTIAFPGTKTLSNEVMLKFYSGATAYWVPAYSALYSV